MASQGNTQHRVKGAGRALLGSLRSGLAVPSGEAQPSATHPPQAAHLVSQPECQERLKASAGKGMLAASARTSESLARCHEWGLSTGTFLLQGQGRAALSGRKQPPSPRRGSHTLPGRRPHCAPHPTP